jgi:hypothetical protein
MMRYIYFGLCLSLIILLSIPAGSASAALDLEGLVGLWLLDEGAGKIAKDGSGNGNDGTLDGNAKWDTGKVGKGVVTAPQNAITIEVSDSLNSVVNAMSLGGWFRVDTDSDTGHRRNEAYLLEDQAGGEQNPDGWVFAVWTEGAGIALAWGQLKVKQGEWTHIAGTYDGKALNLYINGELDTTTKTTGKIARPAVPLGLGKYGGETYVGGMDEIFLFSRALSQDELKELLKGFEAASPVMPQGKLAVSWGAVKGGY